MLLKRLTPMGAAYHLEQLYEDVRVNRMAGIPILNDKLKVQAVGFREWNGYVLGLMITPWFMNLMLLPTAETDWPNLKFGEKKKFRFDAGTFEFIAGEEENLGQYMSCSMFSPMFDFDSHQAAVETAEAIVVGMFDENNKEELVPESLETKKEEEAHTSITETVLEGAQIIGHVAKENMEKPMSRRDLLRGSLFRRQNKEDEERGL